MRSFVTAVISAIEAAAVALAGLVAVAIPVILIWIITFDLSAEPTVVASWVAGIWLLGHLVPLGFTIPPESALSFGLPPEALEVGLSLAPLGIALHTAVLGARSGWRFGGRGGAGATGPLGGALGFGAIALVAAIVAGPLVAAPLWVAVLVPALVYGVPALCGFLLRAARDGHDWWDRAIGGMQRSLDQAGMPGAAALRGRAALVARLGGILIALIIGIAALALAIAFVVGYARVIELSQSLQLDPLGSILIFLAQLLVLPIGVLWTAAWVTGGGFALGIGSSVTPFETLLGPLPALPVLGAIPHGWGALGALPPAILLLAAVAAGATFTRRTELRQSSWPAAVAVPVLAGAFAGLVIAGLSALATGSIGPDRLTVTGASPWLVGGLAAAELGIGALIGVVAARFDAAKIRAALPDELPGSSAVRGVRDRLSERTGAVTDVLTGREFDAAEIGLPDRHGDPDRPSGPGHPSDLDHPGELDDADGLPTLPVIGDPEESLIAAAYSSAAVAAAESDAAADAESDSESDSESGSEPGSRPRSAQGRGALVAVDDPEFDLAEQETDVVEPLPHEAEFAFDPDAAAGEDAAGDGSTGEESVDDAWNDEPARDHAAERRAAREARAAERAAAAEAAREAEIAAAEEAAAESDALLAYSWDPSAVTEEPAEGGADQGSSPRRKLGWRGTRRER